MQVEASITHNPVIFHEYLQSEGLTEEPHLDYIMGKLAHGSTLKKLVVGAGVSRDGFLDRRLEYYAVRLNSLRRFYGTSINNSTGISAAHNFAQNFLLLDQLTPVGSKIQLPEQELSLSETFIVAAEDALVDGLADRFSSYSPTERGHAAEGLAALINLIPRVATGQDNRFNFVRQGRRNAIGSLDLIEEGQIPQPLAETLNLLQIAEVVQTIGFSGIAANDMDNFYNSLYLGKYTLSRLRRVVKNFAENYYLGGLAQVSTPAEMFLHNRLKNFRRLFSPEFA